MAPLEIVPFHVAFVSSEDSPYEATELLYPSPLSKGWRSAEYCIYPQELIIRLETRCLVDRIQVLMHATMVTTSMEIHIGDVPDERSEPDLKKAQFVKLGEVSWKKPDSSLGRQMQTIELGGSCKGSFIKLVLKKNHISRKNEYNQICLMGVNVLGSTMKSDRSVRAQHQDLGFLMYTDHAIVKAIWKLEDQRLTAISSGRDEYAKKLRQAIENLESDGLNLGVVSSVQRDALEKEDFEKAKAKQEEADKMRKEIMQKYQVSELMEVDGPLASNDEVRVLPPPVKHKTKPRSRSPSLHDDLPRKTELPPPRSPKKSAPMRPLTPPAPPPQPPRPITAPASQTRSRSPTPDMFRYKTPSPDLTKSDPSPPPPRRSSSQRRTVSYDDRAIKPAKGAHEAPKAKKAASESAAELDQIPSKDRMDLQIAIEVFGAGTVVKALDKNPSTRVEALEQMKEKFQSYSASSDDSSGSTLRPGKVLRGSTQILERLINDLVWMVYKASVEVLVALVDNVIEPNKIPRKELESSSKKFVCQLLVRTSDPSDRHHDKAEEGIRKLLQSPRIQATGVVQEVLIQPMQNTGKEQPKQVLSRAEMVLFMITDLNMAGQSPTTMEALSKFGLSAVEHSTQPVRKMGERIMIKLYELDPDSVRASLPPDTEKIRKTNIPIRRLFEAFDARDKRHPAK